MTENDTQDGEASPTDDQRRNSTSIGLSDELTRFQIDLLVAAARLGSGTSGQDLKRRIIEAWDVEEAAINHGRLYSNLDAMVEMGLLQRGILDRRTNEYRITDAGQVVLADRHRWTDPSDSVP